MWFSVKNSFLVDGSVYRAGICHPLPARLEETVRRLAAEGNAEIYEEEMRFVSGVAVPAKPAPAVKRAAPARNAEQRVPVSVAGVTFLGPVVPAAVDPVMKSAAVKPAPAKSAPAKRTARRSAEKRR